MKRDPDIVLDKLTKKRKKKTSRISSTPGKSYLKNSDTHKKNLFNVFRCWVYISKPTHLILFDE
jgi:hypothetical protein